MCSLYLGENLISGGKPINLGVRNIGEIVSSSLPLTDAGLHLLDGSRLSGDGIYKGFVDYIADLYTENPSANYFCTEAQWQASVTQYGSCGKFVYDSTLNTVRLPKVSDILQGTTNISALGDLVEESLPNIKGGAQFGGILNVSYPYAVTSTNGAFYGDNLGLVANVGVNNVAGYNSNFNFDASRSSSTYKDNAPVQPQTIKALLYIVVATSTKTDIQVDIDNIATDLNGKADVDLTNTTDQAKILMGSMAMPSDKYIDLTLGASDTQYTAPSNGWYSFALKVTNTSYCHVGLYNTSKGWIGYKNTIYNGQNNILRVLLPVLKGDIIAITYTPNSTNFDLRFIYAVGSESEA